MNLKIGDIVKVVNEECKHLGKQGQVVGFNLDNKENPLRVWFGKEGDSFIDFERKIELNNKYAVIAPAEKEQVGDFRTWDYAESDLKIEPEWSVKTLVERHLKNMCNVYYESQNPFIAGAHTCEVEGCHKSTTRRIVYNIWGTVDTAEVCDKHAKELHLKCMDSFPHKKVSKVY